MDSKTMDQPVQAHQPCIVLRGIRVNNLKNINVSIPRNRLVVLSGLSGSGKSSLARDTIYAEGQRRYVESLSAYARQFLGRMNKPEVDFIYGIPPAIAVEQKVNTRNPRSTVGTSTEIYDYLKLLFARIGITYSPVSGEPVKKESVTDVIRWINNHPEGTAMTIMYPINYTSADFFKARLELLQSEGVSRIEINGVLMRTEELLQEADTCTEMDMLYVVLDRIRSSEDINTLARIGDSVQIAFREGLGLCAVRVMDGDDAGDLHLFSHRFERDGMSFEEPNEHMFSFNNPFGACPRCEGYGKIIGIDEELVIPDKSLSVFEGAVACWRGETMSQYRDELIFAADRFGFPIHKPYFDLSEEQKETLWKGNKFFTGILPFFKYLDDHKYKIQYRVLAARYNGKTICPECKGARLRKEVSYIKINGKTISDLVLMSVNTLSGWFSSWTPDEQELKIAGRILTEIKSRLGFLQQVGLGYLTLNRLSSSLSGGESQRINLATSLGSTLVGSLYILDEPSIGLHPRDTKQLIGVLHSLKALGNTVLVVEHDEEIIKAADYLIDIGPYAGRLGGEVVFEGKPGDLDPTGKSFTAAYISGIRSIAVPPVRRSWTNRIEIKGARENNLKRIDVTFPLNVLCVVSGVSGSGKSTLVRDILYASLNRILTGSGDRAGSFDRISGDINSLSGVEFVDQSPLARSSRSNPVTYSKAYDEIRKLCAEQPLAKRHDIRASHFSFNMEGGRCEECQGEGFIRVPMQFMADVMLPCEHCKGMKFKEDVLEVTYNGKNIYDILEMTVDEAIEFFSVKKSTIEKRIVEKLSPLKEVGLGYVKLGQSSSTLSGGESQRVKLALFLGREKNVQPTLFIFDEPTTGLHFHDIGKLLDSLNALIERGHSVIIIEHNLDIIKNADWVIDLGPEGGDLGGNLVYAGSPEGLAGCLASYTGVYLAPKLLNRN
ncbi:MAG: excinuclease ABC subunit UvrA [Bacteroidales bacterium]|nr:excinuclease ABC subunit UvrA [Bacteroidales bacterium]